MPVRKIKSVSKAAKGLTKSSRMSRTKARIRGAAKSIPGARKAYRGARKGAAAAGGWAKRTAKKVPGARAAYRGAKGAAAATAAGAKKGFITLKSGKVIPIAKDKIKAGYKAATGPTARRWAKKVPGAKSVYRGYKANPGKAAAITGASVAGAAVGEGIRRKRKKRR